MAEITRQVNASSDDCRRELHSGYWGGLTQTDLYAGYYDASYYRGGAGMRFTNITIPQGASIASAHLTLRANPARDVTTVNTRISAEDVDDAPTFANNATAFDTRFANHTAARVNWDDIPSWSNRLFYDSVDIKAVIQEIVNRPNWISGNAIVIFWEDFDDRSTHADGCNRSAYSYDAGSIAPKLVIEYIPPVTAPTVTTQDATGIGFD